ncbi:MAG: tRNA (adenosine(37)-N6)-dimethylallyltransferase MiaA [Candidatus Babeliaceae bacterium]|nr:tRNA (adenosine(37)-N6)-dimethylallyltransferase MiaA [Candidatus Babeliaceae bacterium]
MLKERGDKPFFIVLSGPTASGKTSFSVELAKRLPVEIINGDMGQLYEPLSIGTAKPKPGEYPCPTHLFDFLKEPVSFSSASFRREVERCMRDIVKRGNVPVVVGGSLFYLKSLFFVSPAVESGERASYSAFSIEELREQLALIDPERAVAIHPGDRYRLERALALWERHRVKPSALRPVFSPLGTFVFVFLTRERADLYRRIGERCESMIQEGLLDEVRDLPLEWSAFLRKKGLIGYTEILDYLEGEISLKQAADKMAQLTRNYAKRQLTFWRMLQRKLTDSGASAWGSWWEANLTLSPVDLYLEQVLLQTKILKDGVEVSDEKPKRGEDDNVF